MRRQVIRIDDEKCNGCAQCVPNCPEGALQMVDGKARLVNDVYCDGLGACIGRCPEGAITIEEREADEYDERRVIENVARKGAETVREHLEHLEEHGQHDYLQEAIRYMIERDLDIPEEFKQSRYISSMSAGTPASGGSPGMAAGNPSPGDSPGRAMGHPSSGEGPGAAGCGCPGSRVVDMRGSREQQQQQTERSGARRSSRLQQWPVQIHLVPPTAPYLDGADLLIAADCVPFAYADFHEDLLRGRVVLIGCPKLDDAEYYREKLTAVFSQNDIRTVTVAHMEVPCCFGMVNLVRAALAASGKDIPLDEVMVGIRGDRMQPPAALAR